MRYSEESTSRFKGGDIGWLIAEAPRSRWPEEVLAAGFALEAKGALSEVILAEDGAYLLKKLDSRPEVRRPLAGRLRSALEQQLLKNKRVAAEAEVRSAWSSAQAVTAEDDVLSDLKIRDPADQSVSPRAFPPSP